MFGSSYDRSADTIPAEYVWPGGSGGYNGAAYATSALTSAEGGGMGIGAGVGAGGFGGSGVLTERRNSFTEGLVGLGGSGALTASSRGAGRKVVTGFVAAGQSISPIDRNLNRSDRSVSPLTLGGSGGAGALGGGWGSTGVQVILILYYFAVSEVPLASFYFVSVHSL